MRNLPFDKPGRFYRGNLHTHSSVSDGVRAPAEVVASYRARGYDFLALTDHFQEIYKYPITDTRPFRTPDFATILATELTGPRAGGGPDQDIVALGLPLDFAPPAMGESAPEQAARAAAAGAFIGLAHPAASKLTPDDALAVQAAHAIEIYNGVVSRDNESWQLSDALSDRTQRRGAFAADDNHFLDRKPATPAWVHVRAERLDSDALVAALKANHYYSSQGPNLHRIDIAGGDLVVTCSPARAVTLSGGTSSPLRREGDGLARVAFPLYPFIGSYCRVTIVDTAGMHAWSNPIWLD